MQEPNQKSAPKKLACEVCFYEIGLNKSWDKVEKTKDAMEDCYAKALIDLNSLTTKNEDAFALNYSLFSFAFFLRKNNFHKTNDITPEKLESWQ